MIHDACLRLLKREIAMATGCTEPAAVAFAAANASFDLGEKVNRLQVSVSEEFYRNGLNVGVPGANGLKGLDVAAALGAVIADPSKKLDILDGIGEVELEASKEIEVNVKHVKGFDSIYVCVKAFGNVSESETILRGYHDKIVKRSINGNVIYDEPVAMDGNNVECDNITIWDAIDFSNNVDIHDICDLKKIINVNSAIAAEGLKSNYGICVGKKLLQGMGDIWTTGSVANEAVATTAAAADARMAGCQMPVMSVAGSGNQGLTATLPVIVTAKRSGVGEEATLRALAISILIAIHTKRYVGRLSVLCGCGISAAMGACAAITSILGGGKSEINLAINTLSADIIGVICDGAKPGCALKIATCVNAAFQAAVLAINDIGATAQDGIVCDDAEYTLRNIGELSKKAFANANGVILDMLNKNGQEA